MRALAFTQPRKFAFREETDRVVSIQQMRQQRRAEAERERLKADEALQAQRKIASEAIRAANEALRQLHAQWAIEEGKSAIPLRSSIARVMERISRATGVSIFDITGQRKTVRIAFARQAVMYWCVRRTGKSLPQIGAALDRDHTSVIHGSRAYPKKRAAMGRRLRSV